MKRIGMRNFKTALAVFISMVVIKLLGMDSSYYASIAAVICMQSSVFDSFTTGKNRMKGTFIGAIVGFLFALVNPGNILLCSIGVMIIIYICNIFKSTRSINIACVVFLAIMLNLQDQSPLYYSTFRLIETFIGIIVAVFVNYFIYPPKYLESLTKMEETLNNTILSLFKAEVCYSSPMNLNLLVEQISDFDDLLKSYISEITPKEDSELKISEFKDVLALCKQGYSHLSTIKALETDCALNSQIKEKVAHLCKTNGKNKEYSNTDTEIVYNYHIDKLIDIINSFKLKSDKK